MKLVHLIDNLESINFGIWNAALQTSALLQSKGVEVFLVSRKQLYDTRIKDYAVEYIRNNDVAGSIQSLGSPGDTIIHSHGCWRYPTRVSHRMQRLGYSWVYTPHGMLEPWSLRSKAHKKKIYFRLKELPMARNASCVLAVSRPEANRLHKWFSRVEFIPNGAEVAPSLPEKDYERNTLIFLSRLHAKKGVLPLVSAWMQHPISQSGQHQLQIVGPDDGEKVKIQKLLENGDYPSIELLAPVYGKEKFALLADNVFFILPSFSEGFPTSVVEAMGQGCIPIISTGCNFPEALEKKTALHVEPDLGALTRLFDQLLSMTSAEKGTLSEQNWVWARNSFSLTEIARQQYLMYQNMLTHGA